MDKKTIPKPTTIEDQIINLKNLGLTIENEENAKKFLNDISYYRLVKAYSVDLKEDGIYKDGISFETIQQLYLFNAHFRQLLFTQIEKIEVNFRCRLSNYFSLKYSPLAYLDETNFSYYPDKFREIMESEIESNRKAPHIKNFRNNYENGDVPLYAAVEVFSFGTLSKFYKNMKNDDKKNLAKMYEVDSGFLESWLESISAVRNVCAHYGRFYNIKLIKRPKLYKEDWNTIYHNDRIMAVLMCIKHLLPLDEHWVKFVAAISDLIEEYPCVNINKLGFPINWESLLLE